MIVHPIGRNAHIEWAVALGALKMTFRRGIEGYLGLVFEAHTSKAGSLDPMIYALVLKDPKNSLKLQLKINCIFATGSP